MSNPLFKPMSPLIGWFILLELLTLTCLIGYWVEFFRLGPRPWDHVEVGIIMTGGFIISNVLLLRHHRWAIAGLIICWLLLAMSTTI
ncbi:MAG TPA: hypothetical protein VMB80_05415 [Candidatus Acidoferrum sp.]|nr:hypothetical protein [Candidatus Acidoferrum sp.]